MHPFLSALDCLEDPAPGPSRTWPDEAIFYGTNITYECPYGKIMEVVVTYLTNFNNQGMAFEETYELKLNSTCKYHGNYYSMVYWEFNATNPVPNCIRKK